MIKTFMRYKISAAVLLGLAVIAVSCNPSKKYEEEEKSIIADYVLELQRFVAQVLWRNSESPDLVARD